MDDMDDSGGTDVDGSVFFGDADNGYCFSLTFRYVLLSPLSICSFRILYCSVANSCCFQLISKQGETNGEL